MKILQNERITFGFDTEIVLVASTLEHSKVGIFSVPTSEDFNLNQVAIYNWGHFLNSPKCVPPSRVPGSGLASVLQGLLCPTSL